jgi:uncharacterized protein involved in exopolysaccharide biosynthesis
MEMTPDSPHPQNGAQPPVEDLPSISAFALSTLLLRRYRIVLATMFVAVISAGIYWVVESKWVARSTFIPETSGASRVSGLAGLAAQFGIDAGSSGGGESVSFYMALLKSRELLSRAVTSNFVVAVRGTDTTFKTLADIYPLDAKGKEGRITQAIAQLGEDVMVTSELSGLVSVETQAPTRSLAIQINRRMHALLNDFNLTRRQSRATAEREFVEGRMTQAQAELRDAEAKLAAFLQTNVQYQQSPRLQFDAASLQRSIDVRQQVLLGLTTAYEQARIAEVRNTPVITMIDPPELSVLRSVNLIMLLLVATVIGLMLGVTFAILTEFFVRATNQRSDEYAEFLNQRRLVMQELAPKAILSRARGLLGKRA